MFDLIIGVILKNEGGYVNDPDDSGGETKYGITKARYPNLDIKNLTIAEAKELYRKDFYIPMEIEKIKELNLALHFFDMGVNAGIGNAKQLMKDALLEKEQTGENLLKIFKQKRIDYYKRVATYRNNKKYLAGWLNRVNNTNIA